MKKLLIIALLVLSACEMNTGPTKIDGTIIGVAPQHDTRVEIVYKDKNGTIQERSTHQSEIITDGKTTINPHDYLSLYCGNSCLPFTY